MAKVDGIEEAGLGKFFDLLLRVLFEFHLWPEDVVQGMIMVFVLELVEEKNLYDFPGILMCDFLSIEIRSSVFKVNGVENGDKVGFGESVESGLEEVFLGVEVFVHMFSQSQMLFLGGKELLLEHCALVDELGEG